MEDELTFH